MLSFRIIRPTHFFLPCCIEHLIRNDGLMEIGNQVPNHEAIVFNLGTDYANGFLEEYPSCIFFVGQKLVDGLPVPFGLARRRRNAFRFQGSGDFSKAVTAKITVEYPADSSRFIEVNISQQVRSLLIKTSSPSCKSAEGATIKLSPSVSWPPRPPFLPYSPQLPNAPL